MNALTVPNNLPLVAEAEQLIEDCEALCDDNCVAPEVRIEFMGQLCVRVVGLIMKKSLEKRVFNTMAEIAKDLYIICFSISYMHCFSNESMS